MDTPPNSYPGERLRGLGSPGRTGGATGSPSPVPGRLATLLIPDLSVVAALAAMCYCLFLFDAPRRLFRDSDSGWHIRTGERILAARQLPRTDPYSFTRSGAEWVAWEWGADVLVAAAHRVRGLDGVVALYCFAIALSVWLWFRLNWVVGGNFLVACALAAPMLSTVNLHWLARPHVFGWVLLMLAVLYAERLKTCGRLGWRELIIIASFSALWANLHASFLLAPGIALIYSAGTWFRTILWQDAGLAAQRRQARLFLGAGAVAAAATLLNPYGWNLHRHVAAYLADSDLLARIGEFQSFNFHSEGAFQILLGLVVGGTGTVASFGCRRLPHALLGLLLVAGALHSARALPLAALVALPLANGALSQAAALARGLRPSVRRRLDAVIAYAANLRRIDRAAGGFLWLPTATAVLFVTLSGAAFPASEFPVRVAALLEPLPGSARLLSTDKFGGYLIYRFAGRRKVFFDGRSDLYGVDFLKNYGRLMQARPGWGVEMDRQGFTHALLPVDSPLGAALEDAGWKRLGEDSVAVLLERDP